MVLATKISIYLLRTSSMYLDCKLFLEISSVWSLLIKSVIYFLKEALFIWLIRREEMVKVV